jgi:hypothetical protein
MWNACNKAVQTAVFHATNRGSKAGDGIAYNTASRSELSRPFGAPIFWPNCNAKIIHVKRASQLLDIPNPFDEC